MMDRNARKTIIRIDSPVWDHACDKLSCFPQNYLYKQQQHENDYASQSSVMFRLLHAYHFLHGINTSTFYAGTSPGHITINSAYDNIRPGDIPEADLHSVSHTNMQTLNSNAAGIMKFFTGLPHDPFLRIELLKYSSSTCSIAQYSLILS